MATDETGTHGTDQRRVEAQRVSAGRAGRPTPDGEGRGRRDAARRAPGEGVGRATHRGGAVEPSRRAGRRPGPRARRRARARRREVVLLGLAVLLLLLLSVLLVAPAAAQTAEEPAAEQMLVPAVAVPLHELEGAGLYWGSAEIGYVPAPRLSSRVEIRVSGLVARARVSQRFVNPGDGWVEGVYVFPLPEDGAVDGLRMVVGDRVIVGEVRERAEARRAYEEAKAAGAKASLVEQQRPNVFTTRVANVGPGEEVETVIELQQTVAWDDGGFRLRFPTVVTPRFTPSPAGPPVEDLVEPSALAEEPGGGLAPCREEAEGHRAGAGSEPLTATDLLALAAGAAGRSVDAALAAGLTPWFAGVSFTAGPFPLLVEPIAPVAFTVHLDPGFPLATLGSPSHDLAVEADGARGWRVELAGGAAESDRDFVLEWAPEPSAEPRAAVFTEEHDGDVYTLLMVLPPALEATSWAPLDREVVFILDTSGSMHGAAIAQAKAALVAALGRLEPWDSFNVIAFSDRAQPLFPGSWSASDDALGRARAWVRGLEAEGGTNMLPALDLALADPAEGYGRAGRRSLRQVVFLTDGAVGNEAELFELIARRLGDSRLFTVGIGPAPNAHFMRRAAEVGRGGFTFVGDPGEVGERMEALARRLESPFLADLEVAWDDPGAETWPERLPDLYAGEPLVVTTRTLSLGETVRLSGRRGDGGWWETEVALAEATAAPASAGGVRRGVHRLWARKKIESLMGRLAQGVPEEDVRREVVEVALAHHLVSPYTSLVAIEHVPSRPAGEGSVTRAVATALPAGMLPVGGTSARASALAGLALLALAGWLGRRRRREAAA